MKWQKWLVGFLMVAASGAEPAGRSTAVIEERMRRDVTFLASAECEGRGVYTEGINKAADYIAREFEKAGLKPAGPNGSWFQPFTISGARLEAPPMLALQGPLGQEVVLKAGQDYQPMGLSVSGSVQAPIVFAGYGITVAGKDAYDDYAGLDVAGKIVIVLRDTPRADNRFAVFADRRRSSALTAKLSLAAKHKAAAVLFVNDRNTAQPDDLLMDFNYNSSGRGSVEMPCMHIRRALVDAMLQASAGTTLAEVEEDIDRTLQPQSRVLEGWSAKLDIKVARGQIIPVKNVVGVAEGTGPLAKETIILGAHYDHLGYGGLGSLLVNAKRPAIHHGADDNASGTTTLIEIARRFGSQQSREGRRLVFLAFSAEESGLLGSRHYCNKEPLFPLEDTVAMINLDMVGRSRPDAETKQDKLDVYGTKTSPVFATLLEQANKKTGFKIRSIGGTQMMGGSSDHEPFYQKKVPVLFFFTGNHEQYHRPTDTADLINVPGMRKVADLVTDLVVELARLPERPAYVKVAAESPGPRASVSGPRLGVMPDYAADGEGMLLEAVTEGGAAAKAGIKGGDRLVELAGKPIKGVEGYMSLMAQLKKGEPVEVVILRDGKRMTLQVTPE